MSNGDLSAIFGGAFDHSKHEPSFPPGKYQVAIQESQVRETKAGNGHYIALEMVVVNHPQYNNMKIWDNINIDNPSTVCVEIGKRTLSALSKAAGIPELHDSSQLVNKSVVAHVRIKEGQINVQTYSAVQQGEGGVAPAPAAGVYQEAQIRPETTSPPQTQKWQKEPEQQVVNKNPDNQAPPWERSSP